ncbi:hypothetical protein K466DRAFT_588894 [Polyporus arcularius HHB13444]|uniref:Uncharacterized protein n=1 Tax=Polyporus arcularius HHB13444 TaxID=1314778 RepID=A0A5C3P498_9APHY|nr:hypothetical protein K466DRAFT_588894 [Polyporus arcularius HHB13444]
MADRSEKTLTDQARYAKCRRSARVPIPPTASSDVETRHVPHPQLNRLLQLYRDHNLVISVTRIV